MQVALPPQAEQLANSTDRAQLEITTRGETSRVFVKTAARNWITWFMMSAFGPYRNEINSYQNIKLPVETPKLHCAKYSPSRFVLILEDLRARADVKLMTIWMEPECSVDLAKKILLSMAKIHGKYLGKPPAGVWDAQNRPYFGRLTAGVAWHRCHTSICPGAVSDSIVRSFGAALWHWPTLRAAWDAARPQTLVHGDAHIGNVYLIERSSAEPVIGWFDFQVVGSEHPMRDVTYFLASSFPKSGLAQHEKDFIRFYLENLSAAVVEFETSCPVPTFDECWQQYRLQSFYAMYAFAFSGGVGGNLQDRKQTRLVLERISALMERVDAEGALVDLLRVRGVSWALHR
jgi:hypothetical protein